MMRLIAFIWLACALPAFAQDTPRPIKVQRDIVFARVDGKDLKLDLAMPSAGRGPYPTIVCVHGGAWRGGNRIDLSMPNKFFYNRSLIEWFAEQGYVAVSISYRLSPQAKFPAQIQDCKSAVRWLRAHAKEWQIDPNRIGAVGFSAGGHLVCLLGTCEKADGFDVGEHLDQSSAVQVVVGYFPPTDIALYANNALEESLFEPWLGALYRDKPELYRKASPMTYCRKSSAPTLFIHGTEDLIVPVEHSRKMHAKLKELGVRAELFEMSGESHGWVGEPVKKSNEATRRFLAEYLKP